MLVWEIFDSKLDLRWEKHGNHQLAPFAWGDKVYVIQLSKTALQLPELKSQNVAEVSFFRQDIEGDAAFSTTDEGENPAKVYGVVLNALHDKFSEFDAFYFSAERRHSKTEEQHESKIRIYSFLANRIQKWKGCYYYEAKDARGKEFIVSKTPVQSDRFKNPIKEAVSKFQGRIPRI